LCGEKNSRKRQRNKQEIN
jgi:hypothetical protein